MNADVWQKGGVLAGGALSVLGAWLPSVYKRPIGHTPDGQPVVTDELLRGAQFGLHGTDLLVVLAAGCFAIGAVLTRSFETDLPLEMTQA